MDTTFNRFAVYAIGVVVAGVDVRTAFIVMFSVGTIINAYVIGFGNGKLYVFVVVDGAALPVVVVGGVTLYVTALAFSNVVTFDSSAVSNVNSTFPSMVFSLEYVTLAPSTFRVVNRSVTSLLPSL